MSLENHNLSIRITKYSMSTHFFSYNTYVNPVLFITLKKFFPAKHSKNRESPKFPKLSNLPQSNFSYFLFLSWASHTGNVLHKAALTGDSI